MEDIGVNANATFPVEGSSELNGKDATYRHAPMISEPRTILKQRLRGALVPMRRVE